MDRKEKDAGVADMSPSSPAAESRSWSFDPEIPRDLLETDVKPTAEGLLELPVFRYYSDIDGPPPDVDPAAAALLRSSNTMASDMFAVEQAIAEARRIVNLARFGQGDVHAAEQAIAMARRLARLVGFNLDTYGLGVPVSNRFRLPSRKASAVNPPKGVEPAAAELVPAAVVFAPALPPVAGVPALPKEVSRDPDGGVDLTRADAERTRMVKDEDMPPPVPAPAVAAMGNRSLAELLAEYGSMEELMAAYGRLSPPRVPAAEAPSQVAATVAPPAPGPREIVGSAVSIEELIGAYGRRKRPRPEFGSQLCVVLSPDARIQLDKLRTEIEDEYNKKLQGLYKKMHSVKDKRLIHPDKHKKIDRAPPFMKITQQEVVSYALNKFFASCGMQECQDVPEFMR